MFFAEDVFGGQFCIKDNQVYRFDPETGGLDVIADRNAIAVRLRKWAPELAISPAKRERISGIYWWIEA